jgi:hypothetical protein
MTESQRNFLILIAIALVGVVFSGAFGLSSAILLMLMSAAFVILTAWFIIILYQRHSGTIARMPAGPRIVLQASMIFGLIILVTGALRLPFLPFPMFGWSAAGGIYTAAFWGGIALCGFGAWWAWQQRTDRW